MFDDLIQYISRQLHGLWTTLIDVKNAPPKPGIQGFLAGAQTVGGNVLSLLLYILLLCVFLQACWLLLVGQVGDSEVAGRYLRAAGAGMFDWRRPLPAIFALLSIVALFLGCLRLFQGLAAWMRAYSVFGLIGLWKTGAWLAEAAPGLLEVSDVEGLQAYVLGLLDKLS
ncbi:MAG: hypothetical protein Q8P41_16625 [Pseudomonadota bacterium]|nr:hypothetical protein [Pseudomonadota bacterium]